VNPHIVYHHLFGVNRILSIGIALVLTFACSNSLVEDYYFSIGEDNCSQFQYNNIDVQRYSESLNGSIPFIPCQLEWSGESGSGKKATTSEIERIKKEEEVNTKENALLNGYISE
tara:strand:- start:593 stop:937 length:345 start_codon:yes stop_codon:yes gene_type:complete